MLGKGYSKQQYLISFTFDKAGRYYFEDIEANDRSLSVNDNKGVRRLLHLIAPHIKKDTLGVYLAPNSNISSEIEYLEGKASK